MYILGQNIIQRNEEFVVIKNYFRFTIKQIKDFEWQASLLFLVLNDNKLSSHMAQISEHINS